MPTPPGEGPREQNKKSTTEDRDKVFSEKRLSVWDRLKHALHHMKKGVSDVYCDAVILAKILNRNRFVEVRYTIEELRERRRISKDLIKFLPFSIFLSIPFLEAFLPVYLVLFPNAIPTQFLLENQVGKKTSELVDAQEDSYFMMRDSLPKFANVIGMDPIKYITSIDAILEREGREKDMLFYKVSDFESKLSYYVSKHQGASSTQSLIRLENQSAYELE